MLWILKSTICFVIWSNFSKTVLAKGNDSNKNEARSEVIENAHNHMFAHPTNEEGESIKNIVQ